MAFEVESIPNDDTLFRSIPKAKAKPEQYWVVVQNKPSSAAFRDKRRRVSVNWAKYKTAAETQRPNSLAIVSLWAGECRSCGKEVEHVPVQQDEENGPNQAHAEICDPPGQRLSDEDEMKARDALARAAKLVWMAPGEPSFV